MKPLKPYQRIALLYLLAGVAWILFTDLALRALTQDAQVMTIYQTLKGWLFVALSTVFLFWLMRNAARKEERLQQEKREVFKKTVEGSYHILLNYLNQMQLVTFEAESCDDFDPKVIEMAKQISQDASDELKRLENLEWSHPDDIEAVVYRNLKSVQEILETHNDR